MTISWWLIVLAVGAGILLWPTISPKGEVLGGWIRFDSGDEEDQGKVAGVLMIVIVLALFFALAESSMNFMAVGVAAFVSLCLIIALREFASRGPTSKQLAVLGCLLLGALEVFAGWDLRGYVETATYYPDIDVYGPPPTTNWNATGLAIMVAGCLTAAIGTLACLRASRK